VIRVVGRVLASRFGSGLTSHLDFETLVEVERDSRPGAILSRDPEAILTGVQRLIGFGCSTLWPHHDPVAPA
jgi:hypothetical protein